MKAASPLEREAAIEKAIAAIKQDLATLTGEEFCEKYRLLPGFAESLVKAHGR
jgi:UDP-N-acetylmuramyl tripeptide synthase